MREQRTERPVLRVVVADDNPVVRAGLTALLDGREEVRVVAEASDGHEAVEMTRRHRPHLVLLDVRMPGVDGLTALPDLVPLAPVLMLTYSGESEVVREALRRGAGGYLVHGEFTADQLVTAVRDVVAGRAHLTPTAATAVVGELRESALAHTKRSPEAYASANSSEWLSQVQSPVGQLGSLLSAREAEIMDLIATGLNNHRIAAACFISEKTVKNHINRIFAKLHCTTRAEATAKWLGTAPGTTPPSREVG
ncbi:response regulator [Streptomyces longwoodensis]|uniref:response regulator n=1 Tax=Streptomyces longwoodensis TaxID=68231 RepID=UPI003805B122